jgi:rhamnosyltransferase
LLGWLNDARRDLIFCARKHQLNQWPHAVRIRWQQRAGKLSGFRSGWTAYRQSPNTTEISPPVWAADLQRQHN